MRCHLKQSIETIKHLKQAIKTMLTSHASKKPYIIPKQNRN